MMTDRSKRWTRMASAVALAALWGCGSLTAGGIGEAVVIVSADDDTPPPAATVAGFVDGPTRSDHDDDEPEGELEIEMRVSLVAEDGTRLSLSDDVIDVQVDLEGVEQSETLPRSIPAAPYDALELTFLKIDAEVDAGLVINGVPFTGAVEVELDEPLRVTRDLDLDIPDQGRAEIFVDLNVADWLQALDPSTSTVDAQVFAQLIEVRVR